LEISPSLAAKITKLRKSLAMNRTELGARLGVSPMSVSRWETGISEPDAAHLIKLGNLANVGTEDSWTFWNLAGLSIRDVVKVLPIAAKRLRRTIPVLEIANAGARKAIRKPAEGSLVAIPFLNVIAAAGKQKGSSDHDLVKARSEKIIAAPRLWCPNPAHTVCMRVKGTSMEPVLVDGYIIVVDERQTEKKKLHGKMIVAHHEKFGLIVSRLWRLKKSDVLISENRSHDPVVFTPAWRIVGKVLWWIGESPED
jgi:transcriptional regulator with XRE-family HTH domain